MSGLAGDTLNEVNADTARRNKLINDNNLLSGVVIRLGGPTMSSKELIVRPERLNTSVDNSAGIQTTVVEAEFSNQLMESNYTSVAIKVTTPYVSSTAEYSESSKFKNTETEKTIYSSSRYRFPQGHVDFREPGPSDGVVLAPAFVSEIDAALAKSTMVEKREALWNIFNQYGHVFRTNVMIGGVLSAHTQETFKRSENETEVKQDIKVAIEGELKGWGGGVTAAHGNQKTTVTTQQNRKLITEYIVKGGDYTKIQNTADWIATTNVSDHWRVIEVNSVIPVADLLPEPKRSEVKKLTKPLLGKWVNVERVPNLTHLPVAIYRPKGDVPAGWTWLGHTSNSNRALLVKPTLPAKAGRNPALSGGHEAPGMVTQPLADLPQYQFLATYFGDLDFSLNHVAALRALRPDLGLPGRYDLYGDVIATAMYVTRPMNASSEEDEGIDLQSTIRVKLPGLGNVPKPKWVLKKDAVLFDSGEA